MSIPEPAVKRTTLIFTAGVLWACIGLFLLGRGITKLLPFNSFSYILTGGGALLGILKSKFVFNKIIDKNIERIKSLSPNKEKICIFAFQANQSYILVLIMMSIGMLLRHLPINPLYYGTILILIGTALFTSSLRYFSAIREL